MSENKEVKSSDIVETYELIKGFLDKIKITENRWNQFTMDFDKSKQKFETDYSVSLNQRFNNLKHHIKEIAYKFKDLSNQLIDINYYLIDNCNELIKEIKDETILLYLNEIKDTSIFINYFISEKINSYEINSDVLLLLELINLIDNKKEVINTQSSLSSEEDSSLIDEKILLLLKSFRKTVKEKRNV